MLYFSFNILQQSRTSLKKEVKIKTVKEILLCHFACKTLAKVIIIFNYQIFEGCFFSERTHF